MANYDIVGNIVVIKGEGMSRVEKLRQAKELLGRQGIKTVVEKIGNIRGRLRTISVKHLVGEKNLIACVKENDCLFKFNIKTCYFSPRLSNERKFIAEKIKKKDRVLVMFAGVGVYPIVISKISKPKEIVGVEIGRDCVKYFKENLKLNKISNVEIIQGDVKKKVNKDLGKFNVIVMPRPNLKDSFLESALKVSKKGTRIYYNGFCNVSEIDGLVEDLVKEAKELGRKIKIGKIVRAGDIAPYKFRYRIEMNVLD